MLTLLLDEGREADEIALALEQDAEEERGLALCRRREREIEQARVVKSWPRRMLENLSLTAACL